MAFLENAKKCDLFKLAFELNEEVSDSARHIDLLTVILRSENYKEDLAKAILNEIQEERKRKEKLEENERKRKEKLEDDERRKEEAELQRKKEEAESQLKLQQEQLKLEEMKIQLEMKRLENMENKDKSDSIPKTLEWQRQLRNFELGNDFTLYLVHFERVMKSVGMPSSQWINCLLSALPNEIVEIIMREPEEKAQDYSHVKSLLLKRYKLSPEKFRQLFYSQEYNGGQTWREYYHQLESLFNGWITGLKIKTFDELKDLIIADRIKKSAPPEIREYLMGEWMFLNSPLDLVTKMDEFDELASLFKQQQNITNKPVVIDEYERSSNSKVLCYNCSGEGHFSRDCLLPRRPKFCTICNTEGHGKRECTKVPIPINSVNLSFANQSTGYAYHKIVMINGVHSEAIVDTGAEISIMKFSFMEALGSTALNVQRCSSFPIRGIGGIVQAFGTCQADVVIDKVFLKNVQFFIVADDTFAGPNILIGKNLIDFPGVVLVRQDGKSTFLHINEFKEFCNLETEPVKERVIFKASEPMTIEPPSVQIVSAISNSERKNRIVINSDAKLAKEYNLTVNKPVIPVANFGRKNLKLKKNHIPLRRSWSDNKPTNVIAEERFVTKEAMRNSITTENEYVPPNPLQDKARSNISKEHNKMMSNCDKSRCDGYKYSVGDKGVFRRLSGLSFGSGSRGNSRKIWDPYVGY